MDSSRRPERSRTRTGFSVRSERSSTSGKSHTKKPSLVETSAEKRKRHLSGTTKADPNKAINEAQPVALALEKATLMSLQNIKCNDVYGNPISDPDRSNPTRWRMERPLDTIRSFEVAIDKAHHQRQSAYLQPGGQGGYQSQRSSTYMGNNSNGGYDNGNRSSNIMPGNGQYGVSRDSFAENYGYGPPPPRHSSRMQSEPAVNRYATPGASSGSEQWTGPASEESSLDHANGVARPVPPQHAYSDVAPVTQYPEEDWSQQARGRQPGPQAPVNGYGANGNGYAGGGAYVNGQGYANAKAGAVGGGYPPANGYAQGYAPQPGGYYPPNQQQPPQPPQQQMSGGGFPLPPPKDARPQPRQVISLNNPNPEAPKPAPQRKSWLKRFSRSGK